MSEEEPKVLYKITAYDSDYIKELPDKVRVLGGTIEYYYDFKKHRYLSQFVSDDFDIYDELKSKQDRINKAIEYIKLHRQTYDIDGSVEPKLDDFSILASPKYLLDLLKGDNKEVK